MGKGDALASGQKSATFQMGGDDRDAPVVLHNVADENELPDVIDNSALFIPKQPTVVYKGKPLGDMVLVKRIERESYSSIVIPDSAKGKSDTGIVTGVGPGIISPLTGHRTSLSVQEGDLVLYDKFAAVGQEIKLMDESGEESEQLILREHDILLTLTAIKLGEPHVELAGEPVSNQP